MNEKCVIWTNKYLEHLCLNNLIEELSIKVKISASILTLLFDTTMQEGKQHLLSHEFVIRKVFINEFR